MQYINIVCIENHLFNVFGKYRIKLQQKNATKWKEEGKKFRKTNEFECLFK